MHKLFAKTTFAIIVFLRSEIAFLDVKTLPANITAKPRLTVNLF